MKLSNNFTLSEFTKSRTALKLRIDNEPDAMEIGALLYLVRKLLQPLRSMYGKSIRINSGFRNRQLNFEIGGAPSSQHQKGEAADIDTVNDNIELFHLIKDNFDFDQMIAEFLDNGKPAWLHVSLKVNDNRKQILIKTDNAYLPYSDDLFKTIYNEH